MKLKNPGPAVPLSDGDPMPFGMHKGTKMEDVPASYLLWWYAQEGAEQQYPDVYQYVKFNLPFLEQEAQEADDAYWLDA